MREFVTVKKSSLEKLVEPGRESSVTDAEWSELRAVIAQEAGPVVERQEPAAWIRKITDVDGKDYQTIIATQKPAVFYPYQWDSRPLDGFKIIDTPLYTSPPAPVAVVLPARRYIFEKDYDDEDRSYSMGLERLPRQGQGAESMTRPEYIACIADGHAGNAGNSWCGRNIRFEFHFVSVDHAAISGRNENRLVACSECTAEIKKSLSNGQADTTPGSTLKVMRGQDYEDNPIAYMRNEGSPNNLVKCTFACPGAFGVYAKRAL